MVKEKHILVTGAGGFIGHHLVKRLKGDGHWVRGVDLKYPEYETSPADEFESLDLRRLDDCLIATRGASKRSITWQLIWAGWDLLSTIRHSACYRSLSIPTF